MSCCILMMSERNEALRNKLTRLKDAFEGKDLNVNLG